MLAMELATHARCSDPSPVHAMRINSFARAWVCSAEERPASVQTSGQAAMGEPDIAEPSDNDWDGGRLKFMV